MKDELNAPLRRNAGLDGKPFAEGARRFVWGALAVAGAAALWLAPNEPYRGEPYAVARIEPAQPLQAAPAAPEASRDEAVAKSAEDGNEAFSGVRITRGGERPTARIIQVPPDADVTQRRPPDGRVAEKSPYGVLPKIGVDGARPMDVYARPFVPPPALKAGAPRLAIVVGGLGLNAQSSRDAVDQLPANVTLAFAPYGANLDQLAARARARGHETLLQAPMEPFDYPRNNPGPHTLLTGRAGGGVADLRWLLGRFAGYVGVMNYLGGRFTADETAMFAALSEIARRGLIYLDDGASPRSRASDIAARLSLPFAKVDLAMDGQDTPQSVDAALERLETKAREKGVAIGFANATPTAIARIARFARDLERRGVALAPVSAALTSHRARDISDQDK